MNNDFLPTALLVSVLKPSTDVRTRRLSELFEGYAVVCVGGDGFGRLSMRRWLSNLRSIKLLWRLRKRVRVLVIQTAELLPVAALAQRLGIYVIYDVQENYRKNVHYQSVYPRWMKGLLCGLVAYLECRPWVDQYWLAEESYAEELPFPKEKTQVVANKTTLSPRPSPPTQRQHLVLLGTFSPHYGTREGIAWVEALRRFDARYTLTICGHCPDARYRQELYTLLKAQAGTTEVQLSAVPLPHEVLQAALGKADFLLLPYRPNASTARCLPSKFFEALAWQIPMIVQENSFWQAYLSPYSAAVFVDFGQMPNLAVHDRLQNYVFYPTAPPPSAYAWEIEKSKVIKHWLLDTL
ncbi:MAG: hypothetical protein ACFCUI_08225 [Bernardetiaceae bacterium]